MKKILNYFDSAACQLGVWDIKRDEEVTVTISGSVEPVWAFWQLDFSGKTQMANMDGESLLRLSTLKFTRDSIAIQASDQTAPRLGPGPEVPPLIIQLYLWICKGGEAQQKITLTRDGSESPMIGFSFGNADSVSDWIPIDAANPTTIDWPNA